MTGLWLQEGSLPGRPSRSIQVKVSYAVDGALTLSPPSSVTVPFRTAVEADMARRSLVANVHPQQVMVQQEFTANDSILAVSVFQKSEGVASRLGGSVHSSGALRRHWRDFK